MAKLAERIQEVFAGELAANEPILAVGQLTSGPMSTAGAMILTGGIGYLATVKNWWVALTDQRALFVGLTAMSRANEDARFATPLANLTLTGKGIALRVRLEGAPGDFGFHFGAKFATGLDVEAFRAVIAAVPHGDPVANTDL